MTLISTAHVFSEPLGMFSGGANERITGWFVFSFSSWTWFEFAYSPVVSTAPRVVAPHTSTIVTWTSSPHHPVACDRGGVQTRTSDMARAGGICSRFFGLPIEHCNHCRRLVPLVSMATNSPQMTLRCRRRFCPAFPHGSPSRSGARNQSIFHLNGILWVEGALYERNHFTFSKI